MKYSRTLMKDEVTFVVIYTSNKRHACNSKRWKKVQNVIQITQIVLISCFRRAFFKVNHFYWPTNALNCIKLNRLKSTWINILKDNKKFRHVSDPLGSILRDYWNVLHWKLHHRSKFNAAKHQLRTQNITSNFSEALLILPEDGSQRIRNMSEFLIVF